jgi:hypothetical protein
MEQNDIGIEAKMLPTDSVYESELVGVTPEMIDWFFVNIEKCYPLWHPEEHRLCTWEVEPTEETHIGAIHCAEESIGGTPFFKVRIRFDDPNTTGIPVEYDHAFAACGLTPDNDRVGVVLHQYKATPRGTLLKSVSRMFLPMPPEAGEQWIRHCKGEHENFQVFLPDFYRLWQVVKDRKINRQACMKVKK